MSWSELEAEVIRCSRCGACQQVCPIFRELGTEAAATRGKLALIRSAIHHWVGENEALAEKFALCLACKACVVNCPSGVRGDHLILKARAQVVRKGGLPLLKRLALRGLLRHRSLFRLGMRLGPLGQRLVMKRTPGGALPRLPMGLDLRRLVPELARQGFQERHPEILHAPQERARVALFTGCMIHYVYPEMGDAALRVLLAQGISVIIPRDQHCCGLPAYANGDYATAQELAWATVDAFADLEVDAVLTLCGSCGATLQREYPEWWTDDPHMARRAKDFASKVQDFSAFLDTRGLQGPLRANAGTITYHDSCHLARGMGVAEAPRRLIKAIPGLVFKEMPEAAVCCGGAGSFSLTHYDLSMKINARKSEAILATGAERVVTGCPGCVMQLRDGLHQRQASAKVIHITQLLEESMEMLPQTPLLKI